MMRFARRRLVAPSPADERALASRPRLLGAAVLGLLMTSLVGCGAATQIEPESSPASPLSVRASVDRAEVASGDQVRLTVEVDYASDHVVEDLILGEEVGGLEVLERGRNILRTVRGRTGLVDWLLLRPPTPGSYVIPSLQVVATAPDGEVVQVLTDEVFVEVASRVGDGGESEGLRGLKPPVEPPSPWPWVIGGIALAVVLALLWWLRRRRLRSTPETVPTPHELAFARLEALRATDFTDLVQLRRYYYELSAVLREYVEGRFALNATDLTSQEIRARLDEIGLDRDQEKKLDDFFDATDGVKYAAQVPSERAVESVYEAVLSFVEETIPSAEDPSFEGHDVGDENHAVVEGGRGVDGRTTGEPNPLIGGAMTADAGERRTQADDPDARFRP